MSVCGRGHIDNQYCVYCNPNKPTDFCVHCNDVHEMLDFGYDLSGNKTLICPEQLSTVLIGTMPKDHDGLDVDILD